MPPSAKPPANPRSAARVRAPLDARLELPLFKALADSTRLAVLSCLIKCGRPCSVTEIAESCDVDFSVVNKHLKVLAAAGILDGEKHGRTVWYAARCGNLSGRLSALVDAIGEWCPNLAPRDARPTGAPCCTADARGRTT